MKDSLSNRGQKAVNQVLRSDFEIFFEACQDLYDPFSSPKGNITLNVAENVLSWPILKKRLQTISATREIPDWVPGYTSCLGNPEFLEALSSFMTENLCNCTIEPNTLAISAGATAVIEVTSWILCDENDVAVIPAPSYPVYTMDFGNKGKVIRHDLVTHADIRALDNGHPLTIKHLEKTYTELKDEDRNFKMVILTSPDNPTGVVYSMEQLNEISTWCVEKKIHLIVNEIYGLSTLAHKSNDVPDRTSFAPIMKQAASPYLHLWYSLSKDLGVSGLRVGALHTYNESLLKAYDNLNAPHMVSNHTQWLLGEILKDQSFIGKYINYNQEMITKSYKVVTQCLDELSIPYSKATGSLFVWLDMSKYLTDNTAKGDQALWMDIYNKTGVLLTPGDGFGHKGYGLFRLVHTCVPIDHLEEAMKRLTTYIHDLR